MQAHYNGETVTKIEVSLNDHKKNDPFAVIHFGALKVYAETADDAHAVITAGIEALRLLNPDTPLGAVLHDLHKLAVGVCYPGSKAPLQLAAKMLTYTEPHLSDPDGDALDDRGDGPDDTAFAAEAPGDGPFCGTGVTDEDSFFTCTASPGHAGDHVAYGGDSEVCHTWPQDPPAADTPVLVCRDCGMTEDEAPLQPAGLIRCYNRQRCADRQAANAGAR